MKNIDQMVSKVDIFAQPLQINFEPDKKHGIYIPFVATLALVLIISASTISSMNDLFNYRKVTTTGYRELFAQTETINANIPMVAIKVNEYPFDYFYKFFRHKIRLQQSQTIQNYDFQPCTLDHWKDISQEEFKNYSLSDYYCSTYRNGSILESTQLSNTKKTIQIGVNPQSWSEYVQKEPEIHLILFNQRSVDKQKQPYQNSLKYFLIRSGYSPVFNMAYYVRRTIPYIVTKIKDDSSFFPLSSPIQKKMISLDLGKQQGVLYNVTYEPYPYVVEIAIQVSLRSIEYERNVGKVTDIFIEAGGLYTSVFGIFSIVVLIYYNHKLRLKLAELTFKNNKNGIKSSDYGFIKSLRYGTRGIVKPNENSDFANDCKRIEQNLNEVDSLLHIGAILKRLQIIESTMEQFQERDKFACTRLFQKSSVRKIRSNRLSIEYYEYIVYGRTSITLRDARKMHNGLGMSLEDFLNRRLIHRMQSQMKSKEEKENIGQNLETNNWIVNSQIEGPQRIPTQTFVFFKQNKSGLNTLQKVINKFKDIKAEAEQVQMIPQFAEIEVSLAKRFYRMKQKYRASAQQKIPIIILHRLMKTILQLRMKKQERQQKRSAEQENNGKVQRIEKIDSKEEEQFSDLSDCFDQDD